MDLSQRSSSHLGTGEGTQKKHPIPAPNSAAQAASSLALLLREDRLITEYELNVSGKTEEVAFSYAAALLENEEGSGLSGSTAHQEVTQRATDALAEVHRKLALVESLAERVSRTSPEAVAAPLLRLHGFSLESPNQQSGETASDVAGIGNTATLATSRERGERLKRQGEVLEGVARRVEASLHRGLERMETVTSRLSRVLSLSATLKMILRLKFESSKLQGFDLEDPRDLTRAAASVAVVEDLLSRPELKDGNQIDAVEDIRPGIEQTASAVRRSAANFLDKHYHRNAGSPASNSSAVVQLGTTLQVYYHLGELPQAVWNVVGHALEAADRVSAEFFSVETIAKIMENATAEAKRSAVGKPGDSNAHRMLKKKLKEFRAAAATKWGAGITEAALEVFNLNRVLCRKTDPVGRIVYVDVVAAAEIPPLYQRKDPNNSDFNIFSLFWESLCSALANRVSAALELDNGRYAADAAALYPAVRSASLDIMGFLQDSMQAGLGAATLDDGTSAATSGILGGSESLDGIFIGLGTPKEASSAVEASLGGTSADKWTRAESQSSSPENFISSSTALSLSAIFQSAEWKVLEGSAPRPKGLYPLQRAFERDSMERLCAPLQYMFPDNISLDETGPAASTLPLLPSKYDVQKFDEIIRHELSLADPREGGGDLSAVKMIAGTVVHMVQQFCAQAKNALCNPSEDACLNADGAMTSIMAHDIKVTKILVSLSDYRWYFLGLFHFSHSFCAPIVSQYTLTTYLQQTHEKTFIAPYRPAVTQQQEEAASICQAALVPAIREIEKMANAILSPLIRALNRRVAASIARVHIVAYKDDGKGEAGLEGEVPSFVQHHLSGIFEEIARNQLAKLPPEYGSMVASSVSAFSVYTFVSSLALIRPLAESSKLHITQDLADFELVLEQFVAKSGYSVSLGQIENGKPYAELRAVRQMLFWSGLDNKDKAASAIAKSMLREPWIKDVRPSTVCNFLFAFGPTLLSSPHHSKKMRAEDYVATLVQLDAKIEDGEANAWMTIMACCDAYHQRESVDKCTSDGDGRVSRILMDLGPELLRPRRH